MSGKKQIKLAQTNEKKNKQRKTQFFNGMIVIGAVSLVGWIGYQQFAPEPQLAEAAPEAIVQGEALFQKNCVACHGQKGAGESSFNIKGGRKPGGGYYAPALNGYAHTWHHAPSVLFQIIKEGSPASDSPMRAWKGRMSDQEIRSVMAYMRNLWPSGVRSKYQASFPNG